MKRRAPLIVLVGVLLLAAGGFWGWTAFGSVLDPQPVVVPGEIVMDLEPGGWVVFEDVGSYDQVGQVSVSSTRGSRIDDVMIVSLSSGESISVQGMGNLSQSVNTGGDIYAGVGRFEIVTADRYRIEVSASEETRAFVGPSLGGLFLDALPAVLLAVFGSVVTLIGIVSWALRSSKRRSPSEVILPPAPADGPLPPPPRHSALTAGASDRSATD